ncbi:transglycosylase domain-containing protein, partial [Candidatus Dependentiae bacterium]|nr:transglycosylase domain-containing protein [Candidatus Dependentiae bacterium]
MKLNKKRLNCHCASNEERSSLRPRSVAVSLLKRTLVGFIILALVILAAVYLLNFDREIFDRNLHSTSFYDRNGNLLKTEFSGDERYFESSALSDISPHFLRAVVLIEDKHFYSHHGVYLPSLFRALHQNLKAKRVVSGGSTITMQLVKLTLKHKDRSLKNKISEIAFAFKLDLYISKSEILEEYINRLPFGNLIYGIKQASKFYFNKPPSELSLNQAIYLALIPKSPTKYNPKKHQKKLKKRWAKILEVFREGNYISEDEYLRAKKEGIEFYMEQYPFQAPHFIEMVKEKFNEGPGRPLPEKIITTLDLELQNDIEGIISAHLVRLKRYNVNSAACVVIDNHTHEVIVFVGSHNYFDKEFSGQVNMATSLRQPGSTLKPFVYGLALENGYSPGTIVPDIRFPAKGGFFPENHDGKHHGPLRIREALASSYNIPAFYMAMKLTPKRIIKKLKKAGFTYIKDDPGFYGETIALGS